MAREPAVQGGALPLSAPEIVTFPVELDISNSAHARSRLMEALEAHPPVIIADLSRTEFCDTMGIRCLILASKRMAQEGTELRVVVPSPHIRRVMGILGIERVLPLYTDIAAALSGRQLSVSRPGSLAVIARQ
jgi:anti-sigma B factor antagonist